MIGPEVDSKRIALALDGNPSLRMAERTLLKYIFLFRIIQSVLFFGLNCSDNVNAKLKTSFELDQTL
jgi:hypothetical protein